MLLLLFPRGSSGNIQPGCAANGRSRNNIDLERLCLEWHWARRGSSNVFDASWNGGAVRAVLTIQVHANMVLVERRGSSGGNNCDYRGSISPDRTTVSGAYSCTNGGRDVAWRATIMRAMIPSSGDIQPRWTGFANGNVAQDRDADLRRNCGNFTRAYVPEDKGNRFSDLCAYLGEECVEVCDWQGRRVPCSATSLEGGETAQDLRFAKKRCQPQVSILRHLLKQSVMPLPLN